jgi:hypothetical protein
MSQIAYGVKKQTRFSRQSAKGTLAVVGGGQIIRRTQSTFELAKATYTTEAEINSAQQLTANRHGERTVNGKIAGLLSPGTFSDMIGAVCRRDFAAVTPIAAASFTIAVVVAGISWSITRAAGSFLTDGIKNGQVVRFTAGSFNAANLNKNMVVLSVTATVITVQLVTASLAPLVAEGPIASATLTVPGKVTFVPPTGHTNIYYTVEEWMPDTPTSEVNQDCKVASVDLTMPGSGNVTLNVNMLGLNQTNNTTVYFTAPAVETTSQNLVGSSGLLIYGGVSIATLTNVTLKIDGKEQVANGVVGSVIRPDIFRGKVMVTGSITAYFDSTALRDQFISEAQGSITIVMTNAATSTADFVAVTLPTFDLNTATPMDGETGLTRTFNIQAEYNAAGGAGQATEQTTVYFQDSLAP